MSTVNLASPLPLGDNIFRHAVTIANEVLTTSDKALQWVWYTDRDLILNRAIYAFLFTTSLDSSDTILTLSYKTVALNTAVSSPNAPASYTDLVAYTGPAFNAAAGILIPILGPTSTPVRVPAGSIIALEIAVDGVVPMELATGGFLQLEGYYPK